jgi:hypothetical protein
MVDLQLLRAMVVHGRQLFKLSGEGERSVQVTAIRSCSRIRSTRLLSLKRNKMCTREHLGCRIELTRC